MAEIIEKVCKIFIEQNKIQEVKSLKDISDFFKAIALGIKKNDAPAIIIADYLYKHISCEKMRKRKVSARDFEDFLEYSLSGVVTDNESRKNRPPVNIHNVKQIILSYIASNRREKGDIKFPSSYEISLKTSMPDNNEINMGSFAREALFEGFLTAGEYGGERKSGLGSKPQIAQVFEKIEKKGKWKDFVKRFALMIENIYLEDMLFAVKAGEQLVIYCISGEKLRKTLIDAVSGGSSKAIEVLNRYEGNSIRVERDKIINMGEKIVLDFSKLSETSVTKVLIHVEEIQEKALNCLIQNKCDDFEKYIQEKAKQIISEMKIS